MSTTFPTQTHFPEFSRAGLSFREARSAERVYSRSPFLFAVWIVVALGVVVMFEPSPSDIGIALVFVAGFFGGKLRWPEHLTLPYALLGLFVVANLASLCYAVDLGKGAFYLGVTLFMIVTWLFVVGLLTNYQEQGAGVLMSAFTAGGVASAFLATLAYFNLLPFGEWLLFYDRVKGLFKDPNVFGPYLVVAAVYALHRVLLGGTFWGKCVWIFSCLMSSIGVLLCYSRAAWINYAVTLLLFFFLTSIAGRGNGSLRRNLLYFAIVVAMVGGAIAYAMTIPQISEVLAYRTELQSYDADRFANFRAALELGLNNPLGVGPVQSFLLLDYATHNVYLRVFSENGVLGFLSFCAFLLVTLTRALLLSQKAVSRAQRSLFALVAAALFGTLLNSFTIDTLHWRHYWLLLALGWMPVWPLAESRLKKLHGFSAEERLRP